MKTQLSHGDLVLMKENFSITGKKVSDGELMIIDKNSLLFIIAVKDDEKQRNVLSTYMIYLKTGQMCWVNFFCSDVDDSFSVLAHA